MFISRVVRFLLVRRYPIFVLIGLGACAVYVIIIVSPERLTFKDPAIHASEFECGRMADPQCRLSEQLKLTRISSRHST